MWVLLLIFLLLLFYFKLKKNYSYWEDRGVPYVKPVYFFGNLTQSILRKCHMTENLQQIYESHPDRRYLGFYQFLRPNLLIRDPSLIKQITIKDFDAFPDHNTTAPPEVDTLWAKNLFALSSKQGWQSLRAIISPTFTSSKMRQLSLLMQECAEEYDSYLKTKQGKITLEVKDAFSRYATDVIGTTAFGITCNSLKDANNEFYLMGKAVTDFSGFKAFKFMAYSISPILAKIFRVRIVSTEVGNFFRKVIKETLRVRTEHKIVRPDLIHLLMEAQKDVPEKAKDTGLATTEDFEVTKTDKKLKLDISDEHITALSVAFFFAGFDTISTLLAYVAYELALHPQEQQKLYVEIMEALQNCNGKISYEKIQSMKYLDNFVSECLRLYPPATFLDRKCAKPYVVEPKTPEENALLVEKDSSIWIPVWSIHRDAKYYPDPEKFDPDRFNDDNKHKIQPFTYMPFGLGPRNCIGSRFALVECKILIVKILENYQFVPVEKTIIPLKLSPSNGNILPENGIWVGLVPRN